MSDTPQPNSSDDLLNRLLPLFEAACEERLTEETAARLDAELRSSPDARWLYLTYMDLHGSLYWDAAGGLSLAALESAFKQTGPQPAAPSPIRNPRRSAAAIAVTAAALVLAMVVTPLWWGGPAGKPVLQPVAEQTGDSTPQHATSPFDTRPPQRDTTRLGPVVEMDSLWPPEHDAVVATSLVPEAPLAAPQPSPAPTVQTADAASRQESAVKLINHELSAGWKSAGLQPSDRAEDGEWLRRLSLDVIGRIPTLPELEQFLADAPAQRRSQALDRLLSSPEYARHFTTAWTNLLIGRSSGPEVDRGALKKFLRTGFATNRPWNEFVYELVSAEGSGKDNGAANFLLAHMNNEAVPATALTARLFLGQQLQCVQCHRHPFNETEQTAFWEFNSFFQQTQLVAQRSRDMQSGQNVLISASLVNRAEGGPIFYETRNGLMKAAFPRYGGQEIDPGPQVNRRQELARLMTTGNQPQLAEAFVNRTWQHFLGYSFTRGVDDLGPHNPPSHPELLAGLSQQFVASGYDIQQLIRWICLSDVYQLTSRPNATNGQDDPSLGDLPLFSRVYTRSMSAEQLYDSLLTATRAQQAVGGDWTRAEDQRQKWLEQFIVAFDTEENDEANTFDGTVTQALSLMNGEVVQTALAAAPGTLLGDLLRERSSDSEKIRRLCQAALSRNPTPRELTTMRRLIARSGRPASRASEGYEDLFWALLNSNEFALLH